MAVRNSCRAAVLFNGQKVAKIRNFTPVTNRAALETTGIGECDGTYASGQRDTTASGTLLYDPNDGATVDLMTRIFQGSHEADDQIEVVTDQNSTAGRVGGNVIITSLTTPVQVGSLIEVSVSVQFSGPVSAAF